LREKIGLSIASRMHFRSDFSIADLTFVPQPFSAAKRRYFPFLLQ
jgi:hypothetical protein